MWAVLWNAWFFNKEVKITLTIDGVEQEVKSINDLQKAVKNLGTETKETKEETLKRLGFQVHTCAECGKTGAMWRWYTGTHLCNDCARPVFIKYLQTLKIIIIGLVITYFFL